MKSASFTEVELDVSAFSEKGFGLGHLLTPSKAFAKVEIAHAIPGDRVKINLQRKRKGIKKGKLLEILTPSFDRTDPKCPHARLCGGCTWQQMDYKAQLRHKEKIVLDSFRSLLKEGTALPIIPAENPWHYRNKMEFTFSENAAKTRFLGLMIAHAASYVFNLEECFLANPWMSQVVNRVRDWWQELPLLAYRLQNNTGHLRHLTLREGMRTGEKMIILTVSKNPAYPFESFFQDSFVKTILKHFIAEEHSALSIVLREQKIAKGFPTEI